MRLDEAEKYVGAHVVYTHQRRPSRAVGEILGRNTAYVMVRYPSRPEPIAVPAECLELVDD